MRAGAGLWSGRCQTPATERRGKTGNGPTVRMWQRVVDGFRCVGARSPQAQPGGFPAHSVRTCPAYAACRAADKTDPNPLTALSLSSSLGGGHSGEFRHLLLGDSRSEPPCQGCPLPPLAGKGEPSQPLSQRGIQHSSPDTRAGERESKGVGSGEERASTQLMRAREHAVT